ncbi:transporter substrate-binding domain-containing protein [uncultured Legionella sp.]|uniref:transporter substrate-binding domain-containing protein n=1 Tax=uncultured Legionella sp. TaxID=210934 RepID=UPI002608E6F1|nr:transporter substrate-binding domain-containing protein [uncultured Legionella sp.]
MRKCLILIICIFTLPFTVYSYGQELKVGISHFDPPFVMQITPQHFTGFDISMAGYICKKLNYECTLTAMPWDDLIAAVANKKIDIAVSGLSMPDETSSEVAYSLPYLIIKIHVIGLKNNTNAQFNLEQLNNTNIGTSDKNYFEQFQKLKFKNTKFIFYDQDDALINALKKGKINYALTDSYSAGYWNVNSSNTIADLGPINDIEYHGVIAINPTNPMLQSNINKALINYLKSQEFLSNYRNNLLHLQ